MEKKVVEDQEMENDKPISIWSLFFLYPIALVLLFEEWGWEPLAAFFDRLARLPVWSSVERKITLLPPWSVLFVFGIPVVALLPIKLLALYLFGNGHVVIGTSLLITAKIFGTAFCARLFQLTKPALMKIGWFSRWYPQWKKWKDRIFRKIRRSSFWQMMQKVKSKVKIFWERIHPPRLKKKL